MKIALATSHGRMAPCFAGIELLVVETQPSLPQADSPAELCRGDVVATHGWHPLAWGRELMKRDVALLLCAGIDQGAWAAVQGHGIQVIPNAIGEPEKVYEAWRRGQLSPPLCWPAYPAGFDGGRGGRGGGRGRGRRFRGGRGCFRIDENTAL